MKLYNISFNNLKRRKGKMIFLVMGLVIGIATVVTLLSITESMSRGIEERLNQFQTLGQSLEFCFRFSRFNFIAQLLPFRI